MTRRRGFTIVELLVVVSIIIVLLAITFPVFSSIRRSQRRKRVAAAIETLSAAVEAYNNDWNVYPMADPPAERVPDVPKAAKNRGNLALVYWLKMGEKAGGERRLPSAYRDETGRIDGDLLLDEWDNPFVYFDTSAMTSQTQHAYVLGGTVQTIRPVKTQGTERYYNFTRFQLWSCGPNGRHDGGPSKTNDDIGNFQLQE